VESYEGKTPVIGDHQARELLNAPDGSSLKGKHDRAILATLLYHALGRDFSIALYYFVYFLFKFFDKNTLFFLSHCAT